MPSRIMTLIGEDTLTLWSRVFNDFADDTVIELTYPNDLITLKTGKNQNTIYAKDEQGNNAQIVLRIMRGSPDDQFLNGKFALVKTSEFASFVLADGTFVKHLGDGTGNILSDTYNLIGGVFIKRPEVQENVSGDTLQGVTIYTLKFALVPRNIG